MVTDDFINIEAMSKSRKLNWKVNGEKGGVSWKHIYVLKFDNTNYLNLMLYNSSSQSVVYGIQVVRDHLTGGPPAKLMYF